MSSFRPLLLFFIQVLLKTTFFFSEFPLFCDYYYGPHEVGCLQNVWTEAGCGEDGKLHPDTYNVNTFSDLNTMTLRYELNTFDVVKRLHLISY